MITRLIGRADNYELVFAQISPGRWTAAVPTDMDGTYVLELWAIDAAGNESYFAKALYTIDTMLLEAKLEMLPLNLSNVSAQTEMTTINDKYDLVDMSDHVNLLNCTTGADLEVVSCQVCR